LLGDGVIARNDAISSSSQGWTQNGVTALIVLEPVAVDFALAQLLPTLTVTSNQ